MASIVTVTRLQSQRPVPLTIQPTGRPSSPGSMSSISFPASGPGPRPRLSSESVMSTMSSASVSGAGASNSAAAANAKKPRGPRVSSLMERPPSSESLSSPYSVFNQSPMPAGDANSPISAPPAVRVDLHRPTHSTRPSNASFSSFGPSIAPGDGQQNGEDEEVELVDEDYSEEEYFGGGNSSVDETSRNTSRSSSWHENHLMVPTPHLTDDEISLTADSEELAQAEYLARSLSTPNLQTQFFPGNSPHQSQSLNESSIPAKPTRPPPMVPSSSGLKIPVQSSRPPKRPSLPKIATGTKVTHAKSLASPLSPSSKSPAPFSHLKSVRKKPSFKPHKEVISSKAKLKTARPTTAPSNGRPKTAPNSVSKAGVSDDNQQRRKRPSYSNDTLSIFGLPVGQNPTTRATGDSPLFSFSEFAKLASPDSPANVDGVFGGVRVEKTIEEHWEEATQLSMKIWGPQAMDKLRKLLEDTNSELGPPDQHGTGLETTMVRLRGIASNQVSNRVEEIQGHSPSESIPEIEIKMPPSLQQPAIQEPSLLPLAEPPRRSGEGKHHQEKTVERVGVSGQWRPVPKRNYSQDERGSNGKALGPNLFPNSAFASSAAVKKRDQTAPLVSKAYPPVRPLAPQHFPSSLGSKPAPTASSSSLPTRGSLDSNKPSPPISRKTTGPPANLTPFSRAGPSTIPGSSLKPLVVSPSTLGQKLGAPPVSSDKVSSGLTGLYSSAVTPSVLGSFSQPPSKQSPSLAPNHGLLFQPPNYPFPPSTDLAASISPDFQTKLQPQSPQNVKPETRSVARSQLVRPPALSKMSTSSTPDLASAYKRGSGLKTSTSPAVPTPPPILTTSIKDQITDTQRTASNSPTQKRRKLPAMPSVDPGPPHSATNQLAQQGSSAKDKDGQLKLPAPPLQHSFSSSVVPTLTGSSQLVLPPLGENPAPADTKPVMLPAKRVKSRPLPPKPPGTAPDLGTGDPIRPPLIGNDSSASSLTPPEVSTSSRPRTHARTQSAAERYSVPLQSFGGNSNAHKRTGEKRTLGNFSFDPSPSTSSSSSLDLTSNVAARPERLQTTSLPQAPTSDGESPSTPITSPLSPTPQTVEKLSSNFFDRKNCGNGEQQEASKRMMATDNDDESWSLLAIREFLNDNPRPTSAPPLSPIQSSEVSKSSAFPSLSPTSSQVPTSPPILPTRPTLALPADDNSRPRRKSFSSSSDPGSPISRARTPGNDSLFWHGHTPDLERFLASDISAGLSSLGWPWPSPSLLATQTPGEEEDSVGELPPVGKPLEKDVWRALSVKKPKAPCNSNQGGCDGLVVEKKKSPSPLDLSSRKGLVSPLDRSYFSSALSSSPSFSDTRKETDKLPMPSPSPRPSPKGPRESFFWHGSTPGWNVEGQDQSLYQGRREAGEDEEGIETRVEEQEP